MQVSNAFHSPRTEPILDDLENIAGQIKYKAPKLPLISNLTGELMSAAPDKFYWRRHLREAVRFGDGMLALAELGCRTFLEIGPHPVLLPMAQVCLGARGQIRCLDCYAKPSKVGRRLDHRNAGRAVSRRPQYKLGCSACRFFMATNTVAHLSFPAQASLDRGQYDPYSNEPGIAVERLHPLVGTRINSTAKEVCYEARYGVQHAGFFSDHRVAGTIVLPTTAELEAATVVGRMHFGTSRVSFDERNASPGDVICQWGRSDCAGVGNSAEVRQGKFQTGKRRH